MLKHRLETELVVREVEACKGVGKGEVISMCARKEKWRRQSKAHVDAQRLCQMLPLMPTKKAQLE